MKTIKQICLALFICCLLIACKKENDTPAGCDIKGFWIGDWESNTDESGTFLTKVNQSGNNFEGEISIRLYSIDSRNYTANFTGSVKNKNINVGIEIGGVEISADGNVVNDNSVSGTFSVPYLSMDGTYEGEKIPSEDVQITEIYKISTTEFVESIHDVLCINNRLWVIKYPSVHINLEPMFPVIITDLSGNQVGTTNLPNAGLNYSFDGEFIWTIYNGSTLSKIDTLGNILGEIGLAFSAFNVTKQNDELYFDEGIFRYITTDEQLAIQDTMYTSYMSVSNLTKYKDHFLCSSTNNLFEISLSGEIIKAYSLPEGIHIYEVITNDDKIWCQYNSIDSDLYEYIIYEVDM